MMYLETLLQILRECNPEGATDLGLMAFVLVLSGLSFVPTSLRPNVVYGEDFLDAPIDNLSIGIDSERQVQTSSSKGACNGRGPLHLIALVIPPAPT
jgi:hypothetical protein